MAASVLNSKMAIQAGIMLIRVFVRLKDIAHEHSDLKRRLQALEQRVAKGFSEHTDELPEIRFIIFKLKQPAEL